jgi:lipoprotein signal peptidase
LGRWPNDNRRAAIDAENLCVIFSRLGRYSKGMIIWILALLLVLASVALGYTMGAVRVGITTIGLLVSAVPAAPVLYPMFNKLSLGTKLHAFFIAPLLVMIVIMIVFKIVASVAHRKIDTYYKYKTAEYVQTLWLRANERFGAALGLVNAAIYLFIISVFVSVLAYPVSQLSSEEKDSTAWQWLLKTSAALKNTKMDRAAAAFNPAPKTYYDVCDMIGMVYQNPLLVGRLTSYPPIMELGERDQYRRMFDEISKDAAFSKKLFETPRPPFQQLMGEPSLYQIVTNKPFMNELFKLDFKDLSNYLATGSSPSFTDEILGRWQLNFSASLAAQRTLLVAQSKGKKWTKPQNDLLEKTYRDALNNATIVGLVKNQLVVKTRDANQTENVVKGAWTSSGGGKYEVSLEGGWSNSLEIRGSRLRTKFKAGNNNLPVVFDKE